LLYNQPVFLTMVLLCSSQASRHIDVIPWKVVLIRCGKSHQKMA
jgi:hypothetical protein